MNNFFSYTSDTFAAGGPQFLWKSDGMNHTGRIFYKISNGGDFKRAFLFQNIIDSTFADGSQSYSGLIGETWKIISCKVGKCRDFDCYSLSKNSQGKFETDMKKIPNINENGFIDITFDHSQSKIVNPGELFWSDPFEMMVETDELLCLQLTYSGDYLPIHEETILPMFERKDNGSWVYSEKVPIPAMLGCDRPVNKKVCFLGDSITQGCGTRIGKYEHWTAVLSSMLDQDNSYWNIGLGYARIFDAFLDGAWLNKAKTNQYVAFCLGVNDLVQNQYDSNPENLCKMINGIFEKLKKAGCKVLIQTIPPFGATGKMLQDWEYVNKFIKENLFPKADACYDNVQLLGYSDGVCQNPKYGLHPDKEGCRKWAMDIAPVFKEFLSK